MMLRPAVVASAPQPARRRSLWSPSPKPAMAMPPTVVNITVSM